MRHIKSNGGANGPTGQVLSIVMQLCAFIAIGIFDLTLAQVSTMIVRYAMSRRTEPDLSQRKGHTVKTWIIARTRGCPTQKELSLEDQTDHGKEVSVELYDGPTEFEVVATTGKGERLDRPELDQIETALRTGEFDLSVMEDAGRLIRGADAVRLWGIAVDHGTRCIAPNDCCDTNDETWEEDLLEACADHVGHNNKVSKRCKKKMMNRFRKYGHTAARPIAGYIVPEGARSYDDWVIDEPAAKLIREGAQILLRRLNCSAIADWCNEHGLKPGACCRNEVWDGKMIRRFYSNPLLKGTPQRGRYHSVKHHERGRRVSVKNPKGPEYYSAPHLAILDPAEFDDLNEALAAQNAKLGRPHEKGVRSYAPRRSKFPRGVAVCWYCGHGYVWGAHGTVEHLQCTATREWHCWNAVGLDGGLLARKVVDVITAELVRLEGFTDQFRMMVEEAHRQNECGGDQQLRELEIEAAKLATERRNLEKSILELGPRPTLAGMLDALEERERLLRTKQDRFQRTAKRPLELPESPAELMGLFREQFADLAVDSCEFADLLREIVTSCHVYLVRLVDGGDLEPRARVTLNLGALATDIAGVTALQQQLIRQVTIDVFEAPQRERIRPEVIRLATEHPGWTQRQIAAAIAEKPEQTAVSRAIQLHQKMLDLGLTSPYVLVPEPPSDHGRLRRHKHPRYEFRPLEGYERPPLDEPVP